MLRFLSKFFGSSRKDTNKQILESLERFKNRPIYTQLTAEILDGCPDDELLQVVFDNLSEKLPDEFAKEVEVVFSWTKSQQAVYVLWCLEAEVNNGGFNQYYCNPSGRFATVTPEALRLVGARGFADLVTRANAIYEAHGEMIAKHQDGTLKGFSESYVDNPLNALDDEFYALAETEDLQRLQIDYIKLHKQDFIG